MSFSVPTSPAMSRSHKAQPVTPQRHSRQQPRSQSFYRSPLTSSASPYTPFSHRSLDSTASSTLTTPDHIGSALKKRLNFSSPDVQRNVSGSQDKSLADIADNWRSRASENGIKVAFAQQDDSHFAADDSSDISMSDVANESSILTSEEALLAAPFLTTHRRLNSLPITNRPRAQSHVSLPSSRIHPLSPVTSRVNNRAAQTSSPLQTRRTSSYNYSANLMSTPPPNRTLAKQMKLKGSLTDPAQPRRREALGPGPTPPRNLGHRNVNMSLTLEPETSLDLFDIDENDYEYENDFQDSEVQNSFSRNLQALQGNNYGYPSFPQLHQQPIYDQSPFADPFQPIGNRNVMLNGRMLNGIPENAEHHFHPIRQPQPQKSYLDDQVQPGHIFYNVHPHPHLQPRFNQGMPLAYPTPPAFVAVPQPSMPSMLPFQPPVANVSSIRLSPSPNQVTPVRSPEISPTDCSVCLASNPASLAILQPCRHPLCSACLTSALNIVGEKDMECAVCKQSVADFKLIMGAPKSKPSSPPAQTDAFLAPAEVKPHTESIFGITADRSNNLVSSNAVDDSIDELESAFEFGLDMGELRASTPKMEQQSEHLFNNVPLSSSTSRRNIRKGEDNVVLRIDNVPWDITPLQITKWLQQPIERVHVLLDGKGKTLSHAYVEVKDATTAGAVLRGEAMAPNPSSGKKERGSVLGRGRRARGVTVTRSGQQELMRDLFPHWRGSFDGPRPSLAGLEGERVIGALEGGLLTEQEISGLLHLIREPDSHFLKVPSLPFHSLISILGKFPVDVDSRVFWSASVRDMLLDATCIAIQVLIPRIEKAHENSKVTGHPEEEFTMDLAISLLHTGLECKAFTTQQILRLAELARAYSLPLPERDPLGRIESPVNTTFNVSNLLKVPSPSVSGRGASSPIHGQVVYQQQSSETSLDDLAREFGVDAQVVQALAQRLSKIC